MWASAFLRPRYMELTAEVVDPLRKPCQCDRERHPSCAGRLRPSLGEQDAGVGVGTRVLAAYWHSCYSSVRCVS